MIRSMTGFGKATSEYGGDSVSVELSAVNHRYLDCSVRLPYAWSLLEPALKQTVRNRATRGKFTVIVNRKRGEVSGLAVYFDEGLARQYLEAAKRLAQLMGTDEPLSLNVLAQLEGVLRPEEPGENIEEIAALVVGMLTEALGNAEAMRLSEGKALEQEIRSQIACFRQALATVEARLPELNDLYESRLRARIEELKGDHSLTEERIAIEVALMADKGDVTEEVVRLKTHLDHVLELLDCAEPVGRRLDFLAQEIHREIQTLGVKVRDGEVTKEVLRMKSEVEKVREQIQNIE